MPQSRLIINIAENFQYWVNPLCIHKNDLKFENVYSKPLKPKREDNFQ